MHPYRLLFIRLFDYAKLFLCASELRFVKAIDATEVSLILLLLTAMDMLISIELSVVFAPSVPTNPTACLSESTEGWDFVIEKDEPKTPKEKSMAKIGYKKSDDQVGHMATGIVASVILAVSVAAVVALDAPLLYAHLKMMRRNVSYGMRRMRKRRTPVSAVRHQTAASPPVSHTPVEPFIQQD